MTANSGFDDLAFAIEYLLVRAWQPRGNESPETVKNTPTEAARARKKRASAGFASISKRNVKIPTSLRHMRHDIYSAERWS